MKSSGRSTSVVNGLECSAEGETERAEVRMRELTLLHLEKKS